MAVAVKNTPGTSAPGVLDHPAVVSLLGVLYVTVMLGIVFAGVPTLVELLGLRTSQLVGGSIAGIGMVLAAGGLLYLGGLLLGPKQSHGVRAGIFVGLLGLVLVLLLARWASLWIEYGAFDANWFGPSGPTTGAIVMGVVGFLLLVGFVFLFVRPGTQRLIARLEDGGWFHATRYKPLQGVRVRWATVGGLLILGGTGVYTLISHGTLNRGPNDWQLDIPFTGRVAINSYGDTQPWLNDKLEGDGQMQITWPGAPALHLHLPQVIPAEEYRRALQTVLESEAWNEASPPAAEEANRAESSETEAAIRAELREAKAAINKALEDKKNVTGLLLTVNAQIHADIRRLLDKEDPIFTLDTIRGLRELDNRVTVARSTFDDISSLIAEVKRQADRSAHADELSPIYQLPAALILLDRYALRDINSRTQPSQTVRVKLVEESDITREDGSEIKAGELIAASELDEAIQRAKDKRLERIKSLEAKDAQAYERRKKEILREFREPVREELSPASGSTEFRALTLLPAVPYSLPLLLTLLTAWLAWRAVNLPAFADFLIATEAELNKVSWTTQKRLVQDTIVVLVTVVLMAVYLFGVDQLWRVSLSWKYIQVLVIPENTSSTKQSVENKKW